VSRVGATGRLEPTASEWARVRQLEADIVNLAYYEKYEESCRAADELVALVGDLLQAYGRNLKLLAIRAQHALSEADRLTRALAVFQEADARGDSTYRTWAAHILASHYLDGRIDEVQGEKWLSIAEEQARVCGDHQFDDELDRLRGSLEARRRSRTSQARQRTGGRRGRRTTRCS
jgi:hypothetical protein